MSASSSLLSNLKTSLGFESLHKDPIECKLYAGFTFPMEYLDPADIHAVPESVRADLEFSDGSNNEMATVTKMLTNKSTDNGNKSVTESGCFAKDSERSAETAFGNNISNEMAKIFTSNVEYLEQTQEVVLTCAKPDHVDASRFKEIWSDIKEDAAFLEKHAFMEWLVFEDLNKSRAFLQLYSLMNIVSPMFSIVLPIIMLVFPFVILKIKGIEITFQQYADTLKDIAKTHFIGKALSIQNFSVESVLYFLFIFGIYALQMYQNVTACFRYYHTVKRMNENLCDLSIYLESTVRNMDAFVNANRDRAHYKEFCEDVFANKLTLEEIRARVGADLSRFCLNPRKLLDLGRMLEVYYVLYRNIEYEEALRYSVGFNGYVSTIYGIRENYEAGYLGKCEFIDGEVSDESSNEKSEDADSEDEDGEDDTIASKNTRFKAQYYAFHMHDPSRVKNDISLDKNRIITGVNASGKTTTLKTTAINILVSQQYGFGFYEEAAVLPVHHIHSYLNIPDTSGRDSLFQAESRRCKVILDSIRASDPASRHFCLFDELYSGTNPKEATKSAVSLLKFLASKPNVRFVLTTHYIDVCTTLDKQAGIENWKMDVVVNEETGRIEQYTYRMSRGISTLEGGIEILKNMDYPDEILNDMEEKA